MAAEGRAQALLMVGATQNGKSTLSNFLFYGRKYTASEVLFKLGTGQTSQTKDPLAKSFEYSFQQQEPDLSQHKEDGTSSSSAFASLASSAPSPYRLVDRNVTYKIIDTPGIGDTSDSDEHSNLQKLYQMLIEMANRGDVLSGIIICSAFAQLQNHEYTRNINFYREMFREVFNTNVMIVITNVRHLDESWVCEKEMTGRWEETLIRQKDWLQSTLGLESAAITYLDAMPFSKKAIAFAQKTRHNILQHCYSTQVDIRKIMFVKPLPTQKSDEEKRSALEGQRHGISEGIALADQQRGAIATNINEKVLAISVLERKIIDWQDELRQLDTPAEYSLGTHGFEDSWHFLSLARSRFEIRKQYPITKLTVSQGWYEPRDLELPKFFVQGEVKNMLWKKLSTTLSIYTTNQHYYEKKITQLKSEISASAAEWDSARTDLNNFVKAHSAADTVIEAFTRQIHELTKQILKFSKTTYSFDEMVASLRETGAIVFD